MVVSKLVEGCSTPAMSWKHRWRGHYRQHCIHFLYAYGGDGRQAIPLKGTEGFEVLVSQCAAENLLDVPHSRKTSGKVQSQSRPVLMTAAKVCVYICELYLFAHLILLL